MESCHGNRLVASVLFCFLCLSCNTQVHEVLYCNIQGLTSDFFLVKRDICVHYADAENETQQ